jgi:hypothetical protein
MLKYSSGGQSSALPSPSHLRGNCIALEIGLPHVVSPQGSTDKKPYRAILANILAITRTSIAACRSVISQCASTGWQDQ